MDPDLGRGAADQQALTSGDLGVFAVKIKQRQRLRHGVGNDPGGGGGPATANSLAASATLANRCAAPRSGTLDQPGTMADEKAYLRSFVDETYLWYRDVPNNLVAVNYATLQAYFDVLKTNARTTSSFNGNTIFYFQYFCLCIGVILVNVNFVRS